MCPQRVRCHFVITYSQAQDHFLETVETGLDIQCKLDLSLK